MARKVSLSSSATQFDAAFLAAPIVADEIITHIPEVVSEFSESTGVQILIPAVGTALALIPGEGVVTHDVAPKVVIETLSLVCPEGTKETPLYVITPAFGGRPRWFEKRLLTAWEQKDGIFTVTLAKRGIKDRGLLSLAQ